MTGGVEITRNATKMGRGLVSVQSRWNQIVDESSSTGKALSDWYEQHGIKVYDEQTGQLRSLYDVLSDVAKQWDGLSKNEQAYYLNQQAGGIAPLQGELTGTYLELHKPNQYGNILVA